MAAGALLLVGAARFLQAGLLPAARRLTGDFGAVFPTEYFARLRPDFPTDQVFGGWTYGPMVHFLTLPLFLVPRWSMVPAVWALVNLAAVVGSFRLVCRLSGQMDHVSTRAIAALAGLWLLFQPLVNCFAQGNIELLELLLILAAVVGLSRAAARSGVFIGVATMMKLLPVGFLAWFFLRRQWRAAWSGMATVALICALTTFTLGWANSALFRQQFWPSGVPQTNLQTLSVTSLFLHRASVPDYQQPDVPVMQWFPSTHARIAAEAGELASVLLAMVFGLALVQRRRQPIAPAEVGLLFLAMFLVVPWNHDYYYVFGLVPFSVLFLRGIAERRWALVTVTVAAYVMMSPPIPFSWIDRWHWFDVSFVYIVNYYDVPVAGALLLWLTATYQWLVDTRQTLPRARREVAGAVLRAAIPVAAVVAIGVFWWSARAEEIATTGMKLDPPMRLIGPPALAVSRDGRQVAYIAVRAGAQLICVRPVDRADATCTPADSVASPFFSPDGRSLAFFDAGALKAMPSEGGVAASVRGAPAGASSGSWSGDSIVLATPRGIYRLPARGGVPELLVLAAPESQYFAPELVSSHDLLLYTVMPSGGAFGDGIVVGLSLKTGVRKALVQGSQPHFDGRTPRLLYALGGRVRAVPFDPRRMEVSGVAATLTGYVSTTPEAGAQFAVSDAGVLIYQPRPAAPIGRRALVWVDRRGGVTELPIAADVFDVPRLSPDGGRIAVAIRDVVTDIWAFDAAGGAGTRLTRGAALNDTPVWAPDGRAVSFAVPSWSPTRRAAAGNAADAEIAWPFGVPGINPPRPAVLSIAVAERRTEDDSRAPSAERRAENDFRVPSAERRAPDLLWQARQWDSREPVHLSAWSADGRVLAGMQSGDLWILDRSTTQPQLTLSQLPFAGSDPVTTRDPVFSPDGRWLAFASDRSGSNEIYVAPYPQLNRLTKISDRGGTEPVWARNGRELFYRHDDEVVAVPVTVDGAVKAGTPRVLFRGSFAAGPWGRTNYDAVHGAAGARNYDVAPDGQRFLMVRAEPAAGSTDLQMIRSRR